MCPSAYQCTLSISYHVLPYHVISSHIVSFHITSDHTISYHSASHHTMPYNTISNHAIPLQMSPYHVSFRFICYARRTRAEDCLTAVFLATIDSLCSKLHLDLDTACEGQDLASPKRHEWLSCNTVRLTALLLLDDIWLHPINLYPPASRQNPKRFKHQQNEYSGLLLEGLLCWFGPSTLYLDTWASWEHEKPDVGPRGFVASRQPLSCVVLRSAYTDIYNPFPPIKKPAPTPSLSYIWGIYY